MRIVSLVPSHTESLAEMGFGDAVVGRTRFCIAPKPWVDAIPHVGGTKDADLDKILALAPDLVVADKDENPKALVDALQEAGVEVLWSEIDDLDDAAAFLSRLAEAAGDPAAADEWVAAIQALGPAEHRIPVWCPIWYDPWMTFDATAYPHAVLAAAGFDNVFGDHEGTKYFEVAPSDVAATAARATLLPTEPFPFHKRREHVALDGLGAAAERVLIIDGEALTWFGTRTARGVLALRDAASTLAAHDHGE